MSISAIRSAAPRSSPKPDSTHGDRKAVTSELKKMLATRPRALVKFKRDPFDTIDAAHTFKVGSTRFGVTSGMVVGKGSTGFFSLGRPTRALLNALPKTH